MEERELRHWIDRVKDGTLTRRNFTRMMVGVGLTAPLAAQMLATAGVTQAIEEVAEFDLLRDQFLSSAWANRVPVEI